MIFDQQATVGGHRVEVLFDLGHQVVTDFQSAETDWLSGHGCPQVPGMVNESDGHHHLFYHLVGEQYHLLTPAAWLVCDLC